jgi:hypothetical protein
MQMLSFAVLALAAVLLAGAAQVQAASARKPVRAAAIRDCTPINGRFGYYGNPWCDTGSYRLEDLEYRQRQARVKRKRFD